MLYSTQLFFQCFRKLQGEYEVTMVPKLIIVDDTGLVISRTGRKDVTDKGVAAFRNWADRAKLGMSATDKSKQ